MYNTCLKKNNWQQNVHILSKINHKLKKLPWNKDLRHKCTIILNDILYCLKPLNTLSLQARNIIMLHCNFECTSLQGPFASLKRFYSFSFFYNVTFCDFAGTSSLKSGWQILEQFSYMKFIDIFFYENCVTSALKIKFWDG